MAFDIQKQHPQTGTKLRSSHQIAVMGGGRNDLDAGMIHRPQFFGFGNIQSAEHVVVALIDPHLLFSPRLRHNGRPHELRLGTREAE